MGFTKEIASGSTNGRNIKVAAVATPGTLLHTAVAGTDDKDEVYIYAVNTDSVNRTLTIEFGGTTSPDDLSPIELEPNKGWYLVIPGFSLQNSLVVRAFASAANIINCNVQINRIEA